MYLCWLDHQDISRRLNSILMRDEHNLSICKEKDNGIINTVQFRRILFCSMSTESYYTTESPGYKLLPQSLFGLKYTIWVYTSTPWETALPSSILT